MDVIGKQQSPGVGSLLPSGHDERAELSRPQLPRVDSLMDRNITSPRHAQPPPNHPHPRNVNMDTPKTLPAYKSTTTRLDPPPGMPLTNTSLTQHPTDDYRYDNYRLHSHRDATPYQEPSRDIIHHANYIISRERDSGQRSTYRPRSHSPRELVGVTRPVYSGPSRRASPLSSHHHHDLNTLAQAASADTHAWGSTSRARPLESTPRDPDIAHFAGVQQPSYHARSEPPQTSHYQGTVPYYQQPAQYCTPLNSNGASCNNSPGNSFTLPPLRPDSTFSRGHPYPRQSSGIEDRFREASVTGEYCNKGHYHSIPTPTSSPRRHTVPHIRAGHYERKLPPLLMDQPEHRRNSAIGMMQTPHTYGAHVDQPRPPYVESEHGQHSNQGQPLPGHSPRSKRNTKKLAARQQRRKSQTAARKDSTEGKSDEAVYPCGYAEDCRTGSPGRKVVSHVFGRNKLCTRQIPDPVWVHFCRKHYQRGRYRNVAGFVFTQCDLIRRQIARITEWGDVKTWIVTARKAEREALALEAAEGRGQRPAHLAEGEYDHDAIIQPWIIGTFEMKKPTPEVIELVNRIETELLENGVQEFPGIELLPNISSDKADQNVVRKNNRRKTPGKKKTPAKGTGKSKQAASAESSPSQGKRRFVQEEQGDFNAPGPSGFSAINDPEQGAGERRRSA